TLTILPNDVLDGTNLGMKAVEALGKPQLLFTLAEAGDIPRAREKFLTWQEQNNIQVLNINGPRESSVPGIYEKSKALFLGIFVDARSATFAAHCKHAVQSLCEAWLLVEKEHTKQEERERQKREREAREEAERKERERLRRLEEEERERRELEEQMEEEERQRQEARREAAERAAEEAKRLWDKPPAEAAPVPVVVPALIPSVALPPVPAPVPVAVPAPAPKTLSALMQAQAAGANIAASLLAAQPAMAPGIPGMAMAGGEEAAAGDITAHVQVPAGRVKDLLGVQGRNIKALKSQTGVVKVGVLDRNDPANVEIVGAPAAVEKCKGLVNCIVEGDLAAIGNITEIL
ncbi:unnamed protein product, partial [Symbiodinium necroappetens]